MFCWYGSDTYHCIVSGWAEIGGCAGIVSCGTVSAVAVTRENVRVSMEAFCPSCGDSMQGEPTDWEESSAFVCLHCGWISVYSERDNSLRAPTVLECHLILSCPPILIASGQAMVMRQLRVMGHA